MRGGTWAWFDGLRDGGGQQSLDIRTISLNSTEHIHYRDNYASTTKYTLWSFLPKALFEQYRRVANIFFTLIAALSLAPFSPIRAWTTWTPLVMVVGVSMVKEAQEDYKRHRQDAEVNERPAAVLDHDSGAFVSRPWRQLRVGEIVRVGRDEFAPADLVLLSTSSPEGTCYVETMNLDGETNLKIKSAPEETRGLAPTDLSGLRGIIECEPPNSRLYSFTANLRLSAPLPPAVVSAMSAARAMAAVLGPQAVVAQQEEGPQRSEGSKQWKRAVSKGLNEKGAAGEAIKAVLSARRSAALSFSVTATGGHRPVGAAEAEEFVVSLSNSVVLLRGCSLRNTACVYGVVVYAGHDTKIFMNSTEAPSKRSTIERLTDRIIGGVFVLLAVWCVISAVAHARWTATSFAKHWYMRPDVSSAECDPKNPAQTGAVNFLVALLLYGNVIPISLYVSIEMVRVFQAMMLIACDREMYDPITDTPAMARTSNLNEELGMVGTVLSDKTGTLTCNVMEFFKCSVGGVAYGAGVTEVERANAARRGVALDAAEPPAAVAFRERFFNFYDERLLGRGPDLGSEPGKEPTHGPGPLSENAADSPRKGGGLGQLGGGVPGAKGAAGGVGVGCGRMCTWAALPAAQREALEMFFRALAVCHTVIPDGPAEEGAIKYEAESPDEAALVVAAKVFGFFFHARSPTCITVREATPAGVAEVEYEVLAVLEFSSTRKRMSVVVRDRASERILLFTKGADSVIYERLDPSYAPNGPLKAATATHMEEFASAGLRTLCLSYAEVDREWYGSTWAPMMAAARTALSDRDARIAAAAELIERDLRLLGCTAIEDKLQDGVPEAVRQLAEAGIRLWVLTGDKVETAINIGYACSLLTDDMTQYTICTALPRIEELEAAGRKAEADQLSSEAVAKQLSQAEAELSAADGTPKVAANGGGAALIIDGKALGYALSPALAPLFLRVGLRCRAVVCCRVSPLQKALVTSLVRSSGSITLAIGDGANDVGMIQRAHIGVGISGQEGMQAVMSSDFAIAQFRFLIPLLFVHGYYSYKRITRMISFFFYKNLLFATTLFAYSALTTFSGSYIYNDTSMTLFNVAFTSATPLLIGMFDRPVSKRLIRRYPRLYQQGVTNADFGLRAFVGLVLSAAIQSLVMLGLVLGGASSTVASDVNGHTHGMAQIGVVLFTCVVLTIHLHLATMEEEWTWIHHAAIWGSTAIWWIYLVGFGHFPLSWSLEMWLLFDGVVAHNPHYWLLCLLVPVAALLPNLGFRLIRRLISPSDDDIVRQIGKLERKQRRGEASERGSRSQPLSGQCHQPKQQPAPGGNAPAIEIADGQRQARSPSVGSNRVMPVRTPSACHTNEGGRAGTQLQLAEGTATILSDGALGSRPVDGKGLASWQKALPSSDSAPALQGVAKQSPSPSPQPPFHARSNPLEPEAVRLRSPNGQPASSWTSRNGASGTAAGSPASSSSLRAVPASSSRRSVGSVPPAAMAMPLDTLHPEHPARGAAGEAQRVSSLTPVSSVSSCTEVQRLQRVTEEQVNTSGPQIPSMSAAQLAGGNGAVFAADLSSFDLHVRASAAAMPTPSRVSRGGSGQPSSAAGARGGMWMAGLGSTDMDRGLPSAVEAAVHVRAGGPQGRGGSAGGPATVSAGQHLSPRAPALAFEEVG